MESRRRTLFYPCAGGDISIPVLAFAAFVDEFWFVDINHYVDRIPGVAGYACNNAETQNSALGRSGLTVTRQIYRHPQFRRTVCLNFVTGDGDSAFAQLFARDDSTHDLTVFFHRGDSQGEGGSNIYWLHDEDADGNANSRLKMVLDTISVPGIICTDGSNAMEVFRRHFDHFQPPLDIHSTLPSLQLHGCKLSPIGTLDVRGGPTIVYQVTRP